MIILAAFPHTKTILITFRKYHHKCLSENGDNDCPICGTGDNPLWINAPSITNDFKLLIRFM